MGRRSKWSASDPRSGVTAGVFLIVVIGLGMLSLTYIAVTGVR